MPVPFFRMLTSIIDIHEAHHQNKNEKLLPVMDALVDDACKMVQNFNQVILHLDESIT